MLLIGLSSPLFAEDSTVRVLEPPESCSTIRITSPGSYKLGGNIDLGKLHCNKDAIDIVSGDVTLDLNGFTIFGNGACSNDSTADDITGINAGLECPSHPASSPAGCKAGEEFEFEDGVGECSAPCHKNVTVKNGNVVKFDNGVYLKQESTAEDLKTTDNCGEGITCGEGCIVKENISDDNGGDGIEVDDLSVVIGNVSQGNDGTGFLCDSSSVRLIDDVGYSSGCGI